MILQSFFTSFYFCFLFVTALFAHASSHEKPFSCTGYARDNGPGFGINELHSWSLEGMRNIQIIYLRLPDCAPSGRGYVATRGASLSKLYYKEIDSITATDGNATYTLRDIKELIAFISTRKEAQSYPLYSITQAKFSDAHSASSDHADHIVSAKLVRGIVTAEKIKATVKSSVGSPAASMFYSDHHAGTPPVMSGGSRANIEPLHHDFTKKSAALFKYAEYDDHMCQSLKHCKEKHLGTSNDDDARYAAQYVGREYNVL
ncbi:hypothetical protein SNOG_03111 [Parastagonospora nodorum SN15]|uniref:Uncharacterized protein n=1 Tax=Phaeosphaeria nodorum (strain SN15 / ATCC MYA-4574 / FGSC 10173) TaxID=321614 RepID=Q0UYQ3_PHANO|nr:hypothetical protein SNOG_03111 [Parastagonospora nodorum SN15]EAT89842.2 hypothetical protein SNOG_03111 [Parastagonospora nodorum SN15]